MVFSLLLFVAVGIGRTKPGSKAGHYRLGEIENGWGASAWRQATHIQPAIVDPDDCGSVRLDAYRQLSA